MQTSNRLGGRNLLVVDDEDNLRSMLAAALRHHGFDVALEADGEGGCEHCRTVGRTSLSSTS